MAKLLITFKNPDAVSDALNNSKLSPKQKGKAKEVCYQLFRHGECVDLEIDIDTGQITVLLPNE